MKRSKRKWSAPDLSEAARTEMVEAHNRYQWARQWIARDAERAHGEIRERVRKMLADNEVAAEAERERIIAADRERQAA